MRALILLGTFVLCQNALAGNVEIKITVRDSEIARAERALGLTPVRAERRLVYFFDTRDLALFGRGLLLRARQVQGGAGDSTVKRRPMEASAVPRRTRALAGFKCEEDRVGARRISSCSLTVPQKRGEIEAVVRGERPVKKLFSQEQERFAGGPDFGALRAFGPVDARVWKVRPRDFPPGLTAERWSLPGGRVLLEVSTRVTAARADATARRLSEWLRARGIDPAGVGETKTRAALESFAGR
jgi:hypothetical protein